MHMGGCNYINAASMLSSGDEYTTSEPAFKKLNSR